MSSKQLDSILNKLPSATAKTAEYIPDRPKDKEPNERIVAVVPKSVKVQIKKYIETHRRETERTIVLRGLKAIGYEIKDEWLVDKRTTR